MVRELVIDRDGKFLWKVALIQFGQAFLQPVVLLYFGLAATMVWWINAVVYVLLETLLFDPRGIILMGIETSAVVCIFGGFSLFMVRVVPKNQRFRIERQRFKQEGNLEAYHKAWDDLALHSKSIKVWPVFASLLSVYIMVPAAIALAMSSGFATHEKETGLFGFRASPANTRDMLHYLEKHGLFTPPDRSQD